MTPLRIFLEIVLVWTLGIIALVAMKRKAKQSEQRPTDLAGARSPDRNWLSLLIFAGMLAFPSVRIGMIIWQIQAHGGDPDGKGTCYYKVGNTKRSYQC